MTQWRPAPRIAVKAIGLVWREGLLLAAEVPDDSGQIIGLRPLGGSAEFGERWDEALRREFREELGLEVAVTGDPAVMENIYHHKGAMGHEVIFVATVTLPPDTLPGLGPVAFKEHDGADCVARWVDPATLDCDDGPALFPTGLKALITR